MRQYNRLPPGFREVTLHADWPQSAGIASSLLNVDLPKSSSGAGPAAEFAEDLDALAAPLEAQPLYDSRWYDPSGRTVTPGGILTSRGCPARCTFCANYVTGRGFRYRSAASVVNELNRFHDLTGADFFPFWDDALTANRPRLFELCRAFQEGIRFPIAWSAITRANMVTPELLDAMKRAGCVAVNFGVESGDDAIPLPNTTTRSVRRPSGFVQTGFWEIATALQRVFTIKSE